MKRLKIMAALLVILSLAFLCVACGNKLVAPAGEDENSGTAQQDTVTDDKTSAEDKTSNDNTNPTEGGAVIDEPVKIGSGGVVDDPAEDGDNPLVGPDDSKPDTKPNKPSDNTDTPDASQDLKWEEFYALAPEQKDAYLKSFGDYEKFYNWMVKAQEQFKTDYPTIEIGADGTIDLSKLK